MLWLCKRVAVNQGLHCTESPIYLFPEMKLRDLVPNSYIHVSVTIYTERYISVLEITPFQGTASQDGFFL